VLNKMEKDQEERNVEVEEDHQVTEKN